MTYVAPPPPPPHPLDTHEGELAAALLVSIVRGGRYDVHESPIVAESMAHALVDALRGRERRENDVPRET